MLLRSISIEKLTLLTILLLVSCQPQDNAQKPRIVNENGQSYLVQDSLLIETRDGAKISTIIVRNEQITKPQTSILFHTIYARPTDIKRAKKIADRGYVSIISYTRGKALSPDKPIPMNMK